MGDEHSESCGWCQAHDRAAIGLLGKRLGKHERRVLLDATPPRELPSPILPDGPLQPSQTATRRAVAALREAKLIWVPEEKERVDRTHANLAELLTVLNRQYAVVRFASRTDLGEAVVQVFAAELASGGRLRWGIKLDELAAATLARCPHR